MPNKNYLRGRRYEYELVQFYKQFPMAQVYRTAGSHGFYDVIAILPDTKEIFLIQCKTKVTDKNIKTGTVRDTELIDYGVYTVYGRKSTKYIQKRGSK